VNRLWLRIAGGIALSLFVVFFLQFLAITFEAGSEEALPERDARHAGLPAPTERAVVQARLLGFAGLSALVGVAGGLLVAVSVVVPLRRISKAAERIGRGELEARAPEIGARELAELGKSFNAMAAALERLERERTKLFADLSHELRTPLAALEANLQAAFDGVAALDGAGVSRLLEQTRHLGRLVNDLRELSLSESGRLPLELGPVDLLRLAEDTAEALGPLALERGVRLGVEGGGSAAHPPCVRGDEIRLRQVLFNLAANAIRHAGAAVSIRVSGGIAGVGLPAGPRGGYASAEEDIAIVEVEDDGTGLSPEELASVFGRFYRTDP